jgi:GNAT superfamily N-acetyltransferase
VVDIRELAADETALAYRAMRELRPHVTHLDDFLHRVNQVQRPQGYRLIASFDESSPDAVAALGFRIADLLHRGHHLYIDDLSTLPEARRQGHATALLTWAKEEAGRLRCSEIHLDSGTHRHNAHRRYLSFGFDISAHHFSMKL